MEVHPEPERPAIATIVDVLNEDCWRAILNLIDVKDIIRSERVSQQWQNVIFQYLQGVRISIEYPWYAHETRRSFRVLTIENADPHTFNEITRKWGPYIKKADCISRASLKVIAKQCPNLEDITFYGLHDFALLNGAEHSFTKLKRVYFRGCECATDNCISKWLGKDTLEELAISVTEQVTGPCLVKVVNQQSSNLKSLSLRECPALEVRYLLSAVDHLTGLKKLELVHVPKKIFQNVHVVLSKLPNLEDLCLRWGKKMVMGNEVAESISHLRLKRLDLSFNPNVSDEWLEIIARGCGCLQELVVEGCLGVSACGVGAVCGAAGPALRALHVGSNGRLLDHHVAAFITACPNLTCVDVSYCRGVTEKLMGAAAAARARRPRLRLRLRAARTVLEAAQTHEEQYPGLILDFSE